MKHICFSIGLLLGMLHFAQAQLLPAHFISRKWEVNTFYSQYKDQQYLQYHKDSSNNKLDYAGITYDFESDKSYTSYHNTTQTFKGVWRITSQKDSIYLDSIPRYISRIDEENLILRSYSLIFADTSAKLDTVYAYLHLVPVPEVVMGLEEEEEMASFSLFPNPASKQLTVTIANGRQQVSAFSIQLISSVGHRVKEITLPPHETTCIFPTESLVPGLYFIRITNSYTQQVITKTFVKE